MPARPRSSSKSGSRQSVSSAAYYAACRWCDERGISHGSMQAHRPIGLLAGEYAIAKWRSLNAQERRALDGTMTGDFRNGPVLVRIRAAALAASNEGAPA